MKIAPARKMLLATSAGAAVCTATCSAASSTFAPRSVTDQIDALERDGLVTRTEDAAHLERDIDLVASTGVRWLRVTVRWSTIEPRRDDYRWTRLDAVIDAARRRRLTVLAVVLATPVWARPGGSDAMHPPSQPADLAARMGVLRRAQAHLRTHSRLIVSATSGPTAPGVFFANSML